MSNEINNLAHNAAKITRREQVHNYLRGLQASLCKLTTELDKTIELKEFFHHSDDPANNTQPTYGLYDYVGQDGELFEKVGINFTEFLLTELPESSLKRLPAARGHECYVTGTSALFYARNPHVPYGHLNCRYFEAGPLWWFGGGLDLTPYYLHRQEAIDWHRTLKETCDRYSPEYYPHYKQRCDNYLYNKHRQEQLGLGGLFIDHLNGPEENWPELFSFMQDVSNLFAPTYGGIVERTASKSYTEEQRRFQSYRRGQLVEFFLMHSVGVAFGMQSNLPLETQFLSFPPTAGWFHRFPIAPGSPEAALTSDLLVSQDWAAQ